METVLCSKRHVTEPTLRTHCGIFIVSWRDILASGKQKVNLIYFNMCLSICFSSLILPSLQPTLPRSIPVIHFYTSHQRPPVQSCLQKHLASCIKEEVMNLTFLHELPAMKCQIKGISLLIWYSKTLPPRFDSTHALKYIGISPTVSNSEPQRCPQEDK